jgi:hypothetical protein
MNLPPPRCFALPCSFGCLDLMLRPGALQPGGIQRLAWSSSLPEA